LLKVTTGHPDGLHRVRDQLSVIVQELCGFTQFLPIQHKSGQI
jgi:hypothetical protein